ncbi:glycosyltransferase [Arenicella xantha]|uniref:GT2 family glycosyltransferase n=1 Tax=Arenicella xantha TaxID=644221 RepID=A0A395JRL4_9GAMM|nr:glycosyltransferase [Arenicella xantha]RBP52972.1 GT2 family glycosyltransferase [Arenicella xantha]
MNVNEISIIVPVKDNQRGIDVLLTTFFDTFSAEDCPLEIIIVDNGSAPSISIDPVFLGRYCAVRLLTCTKRGPGAARNTGAKKAKGAFLLFIDSDCVPAASLLTGYVKARVQDKYNSVGYSGFVDALGDDVLSNYYVSQNIHLPPKVVNSDAEYSPKYLVTANALVCKIAFDSVGGFDESFVLAGGEDIDLALRLKQFGALSFASESVVFHDFNDGLIGFIKRFFRYGQGIRLVKEKHPDYRFPAPFTANEKKTLINNVLVILQWGCMYLGYLKQEREFLSEG